MKIPPRTRSDHLIMIHFLFAARLVEVCVEAIRGYWACVGAFGYGYTLKAILGAAAGDQGKWKNLHLVRGTFLP